VPRYLKAISLRIEKLRSKPGARRAMHGPDAAAATGVAEAAPGSAVATPTRASMSSHGCCRNCALSLFAQELKTPVIVSVKRLKRCWRGFGLKENTEQVRSP